MKQLKFTGFVINRRNFSEADKIITVYTREHGKINLKVAGVRKISSKRAGSVELFNLISGSAVTGRSQHLILTEVQVLDSFSHWKKQLGRLNLAYQISEAVDSLTPDSEPHPEVYELLLQYLNSIADFGPDWQHQTADFLLQLLTILGFWPAGKPYSGDIYSLIETTSNRRFNSSKLLQKLSRMVE